MRFSTPRRANPFDNPLVSMLVHVTAVLGAIAGAYISLQRGTVIPICVSVTVLSALEGAWWFYFFRR
jgi:hypothetical protein